ncbi:MAG: HD domain-containing phosphohydrolase [Syntrophorhabdales bacterium]|jgi:putative nucleotidyltransferase with HDIG domain
MDNALSQGHTVKGHKEILILEDSKAQAQRLVEMLSGEGYSVTASGDGLEGLYALMGFVPDLIISDVGMPRLDGYEFCQVVKTDEKLAHIPLILLTSLSEPKDIIKGLSCGADYYLTKPYSKSLLLSMVSSIIAGGDSQPHAFGAEPFEIRTGGTTQRVSASPQQVANFLFSTYENLLSRNDELSDARRELRSINDRLEERIREKTRSLEEEVMERRKANEALLMTLNGTVVALARTVEMRDPYTAGHQMRVSELACAMAGELDFPEDRLEGLKVMGMLHDIGKIIVPAEILAKPSRLTEYEFLFIKAHAQAGYDILKEIRFPWPVATAVFQHHERLDGSGYPLGIAGDDIMMESRILAVADVAESMSSHRPYRPALGTPAALEEIVGHKGLYDPDVTNALLKVLKAKGTI